MLSDDEEELRREALSLESADADTGEGMVNASTAAVAVREKWDLNQQLRHR